MLSQQTKRLFTQRRPISRFTFRNRQDNQRFPRAHQAFPSASLNADVLNAQTSVFGTFQNPQALRSGRKVLRKELPRGFLNYYGVEAYGQRGKEYRMLKKELKALEAVVTPTTAQIETKADLAMVLRVAQFSEEQIVKEAHNDALRRRGKGAPKKGQGKRASRKK